MRHLIFPLAAFAALATAGLASAKTLPTSATSPAFTGHKYAAQAKVTLAQARDTALKAHPGAITDEELEREKGGSGLRYSFDIKDAKGGTYEVGVDAKTGAVLEQSREGAHPD